MKPDEKEILETIKSELLPGEKIFLFGPGARKTTPNRLRVFSQVLMMYGVSAVIAIIVPHFADSEIVVLFALCAFGAVFLISIFMIGISIWDTYGPQQYYALTNDRFLCLTDDGIKTISKRSAVSKMHAKEDEVTVTVGAEDVS